MHYEGIVLRGVQEIIDDTGSDDIRIELGLNWDWSYGWSSLRTSQSGFRLQGTFTGWQAESFQAFFGTGNRK